MWFRVLDVVERAIIDLAIRCVDRVQSVKLEQIMAIIIERVENAFVNGFALIEQVGRTFAKRLSEIASKGGNVSAFACVERRAFLGHLAVLNLSISATFRSWVG